MRPEKYRDPPSHKEWRLWCRFAAYFGQHPYLLGLQGTSQHLERSHLFLAFAAALRNGFLEHGQTSSALKIERTLLYCGKALGDRGYADPRRAIQGQHPLDPRFTAYLNKCKREDPPALQQQALPSSTIKRIAETYGASSEPRLIMTAELITVAFFFLLRLCEYTPRRRCNQCTVPLRKKDIVLWRGGSKLSNDAAWHTLTQADAVTIHLEDQKNGHKHAVLHHDKSNNPHICPVRSMIRLIHAIRGLPDNTPLGTYHDKNGARRQVQDEDIRAAIRAGAHMDNLEAAGYDLTRIGSHSLRTGGAVALKLAGYDHDIIKKLGRWSSNTYLRYIQTQVAQLSQGVSHQMARLLRFQNVG